MMRRLAEVALALGLLPGVVFSQAVRGVVTDSASGNALRGVVVTLIDDRGREVTRGLSSEAGEFRLSAPTPGTYRVRTLRIGFRPSVSSPITLSVDTDAAMSIAIAGVPFSLDTVRVAGRAACEANPDSVRQTYAVWQQVRAAVAAAQVTAASRAINARVVTYRRVLEPVRERVVGHSADVRQGLTARPWNSLGADRLRRSGYVHVAPDGDITFYAPDLAVLLSEEFIADHCLQLSDDSDAMRLGIEFQPTADRRRTPEIRGTLWLDRRTNELLELEFRYVNVDREQTFGRSGGELHFARMSNGGFVISRWNIRMPQLDTRIVPQPGMRVGGATVAEPFVREVLIEGGELALVTRGADTLWARFAVLRGRVVDSASGRPVGGARVAVNGTGVSTLADARGEFAVGGLVPGQVTLTVARPELESVGLTHSVRVLLMGDSTGHVLRVPAPPRAVASGARLTGVVLDAVNGAPLPDVEVSLPVATRAVFTHDSGRYTIEGIASGRHAVVLRRVGYRVHSDTIAFQENERVTRSFVMHRVAILDTIAVVESYSPRGFEENRRLGLGIFFTRAQLAKLEDRTMAAIFGQLPAVQMIRTNGSATYVASLRGRESRTGEHDIGGSGGLGNPPPPACYSLVYLDNHLMYNGKSGQVLFNLNKLNPASIEAIEYYPSETGLPIRYVGPQSGCGVLVLHTRRSK